MIKNTSLSVKFLLPFFLIFFTFSSFGYEPRLYWWSSHNFGDYLSKVIVERIIGKEVRHASSCEKYPILFAVGSVMRRAKNGDIIWGSGYRQTAFSDIGKKMRLDVRAVRGPKTRAMLLKMGVKCPAVYGDPALLLPYLFPEFTKQPPVYEYIIIPHISDRDHYRGKKNVVNTNEPWKEIIDKILKSKLVISSSLHGIIVAEAFGIPARLIKPTRESLLKYQDYYESTGRPQFRYALTLEEALKMKGEKPIKIDLQPLMDSFPYDYFSLPKKRIRLIKNEV